MILMHDTNNYTMKVDGLKWFKMVYNNNINNINKIDLYIQ